MVVRCCARPYPSSTSAPIAESSLRVVSMSRTCGIFSRTTGSSVSRAAAMAGSAAFFAPLMRTVPSNGFPPRMTNLSIGEKSRLREEAVILTGASQRGARQCDRLSDVAFGVFQRCLGVRARHSRLLHHNRNGNAASCSAQRSPRLRLIESEDLLQDKNRAPGKLRVLLMEVDHEVAVDVSQPDHCACGKDVQHHLLRSSGLHAGGARDYFRA